VNQLTEKTLANDAAINADICIIGSGPAGLTLAAELTACDLQVVVVESGKYAPDEDIQELNQFESSGKSLRAGTINRLRMVGGTSNLWPGRCMAFEPIDFHKREWLKLPGWPLDFQEYASFLSRAAQRLALSSKEVQQLLNTSFDNSRMGVPSSFSLKLALWGKSPKRFIDDLKTTFANAPKFQLVSGFTVTDFCFGKSGDELFSVGARSLNGKGIRIGATCFVMSCGGLENARSLLLAKRQNPHAHFSIERVGRWFMDHPRAVCGRIRLHKGVDWSPLLGHPISGGLRQFGLGLSNETQEARQMLNCYVYVEPEASQLTAQGYGSTIRSLNRVLNKGHTGKRTDFSGFTSIKELIYQLTPREVLPNWLYRMYFNTRKIVKRHKRNLLVINHCEQLPDRESRLTLSRQSDGFGNPLLNVHWKMDPLELDSLMEIHEAIGKWLETHNIGSLESSPQALHDALFSDASHHIGTTRMSDDATEGVVDVDLKVHGVKNLYMNGSSVFPTSGCGNPTWSIVAFAIRLADHLKREIGQQRG
jgi:hypothetical protein